MSSEVAIRVEGLVKDYHIYATPVDRLKQGLLPRLARLLGRAPGQYFTSFRALDGISFEVQRGQTVGIIGRNGSGKSTLLQIICGTLSPTFGQVEVNGRVAALLELGSGFNPEFTGHENVYMYASIMGLTREQIDARYSAILEFADIGDFIDQPVKTYSSGMMVRLAFAVIVHVDADILIIDEALAVGDAFFVQKCMRFLRRFMKTGTVLFVSHDSGAITNLCSHAIWLEKGGMRDQGSPKSVTEAYLEAQYSDGSAAGMGDGNPSAFEVAATPGSSPIAGAAVSRVEEATVAEEASRSNEMLHSSGDGVDMRRELLLSSALRNDISIGALKLDEDAFGEGGGRVVDVQLQHLDTGRPLAWAVGGELCRLSVRCHLERAMEEPIVGFFIKDRLGQTLFGDNTCISHPRCPLEAGQHLDACFDFRMPILPIGQYSVCVALAEGTQEDHVQHHWVHDALMITSHTSSVAAGLVGIPMLNIAMGCAGKESAPAAP